MEALQNLIKNLALFILIGIIPSLCWAAGLFSAFSLTTLFFLVGGFFFIFWLKTRQTTNTLRKLLLSREEAWALCEGDQIVDRSPSFPGNTLDVFYTFLHPDSLDKTKTALGALMHHQTSFQIRVYAAERGAIYSLEGISLEDKSVLWFKNTTDLVHQEQFHKETMHQKEVLLTKLRDTLDLLPLLFWRRDAHQRIYECNQGYALAVQSSPHKIYDEGIELIQPRFARVLARKALHLSEVQVYESRAIADGTRHYFRIFEMPDDKNQGQGTVGVALDITELQESRSEMRNLVNSYDKVLDHLRAAIAVYDAEGVLRYYNQAYLTLHGFEPTFLNSCPRHDEVLEDLRNRRQLPECPDFPAYKREQLQKIKEQVDLSESLLHLPDERTLRVFSAPHPMGGLLFMSEDVTDYLALERNNKALLDAYQATLDNLFEAVVVIGSDNRLKIFNPSFVRLWNFSAEDIKPLHHLAHIVEKLKDFFAYEEEWESYKAHFIEKATDRIPKTGQLKREDGIVLNFRYVPLPNGDNLLSYTDATDTSRVQKAQEEKNEAFDTVERLKSQFIANISYELKSPLNTIIGFTEILSHKYFGELNERQTDYITGVLESSRKLMQLVNDILELASFEGGHITLTFQTTHIPTLLQEALVSISPKAAAHKQHIILHCDPALGDWMVDEKRLKQTMINLLRNAIQFTPPQETITFEASIENDELKISVTDKGIGIPLEDQAHVFEKFERGSNKSSVGAGLGLSLVKNFIELHGGRVELESIVNEGTKVICCLPKTPGVNQEERVA